MLLYPLKNNIDHGTFSMCCQLNLSFDMILNFPAHGYLTCQRHPGHKFSTFNFLFIIDENFYFLQ